MLPYTPTDDMTLQEALCAPGGNVLIYDTFNASACAASAGSFLVGNNAPAAVALPAQEAEGENKARQGRRKRRRRRERGIRKNREDAESQRMTHIAVERNRRRQMNEYFAVLRSLMPESYVHQGDQASIVSGAIDCVKELEQQLQSLEAQKRALMAAQQQRRHNTSREHDTARATAQTPMSSGPADAATDGAARENGEDGKGAAPASPSPFSWFFRYPQYVWRHAPPREDGVADVEVSVVVDAHASARVMAPRRPGQLLKMVAGLQALGIAVLHLNVTAAGALVLYTLSLKVEDGCALKTADEIAAALHHVLCLVEAEATAQQRALDAGPQLVHSPHL